MRHRSLLIAVCIFLLVSVGLYAAPIVQYIEGSVQIYTGSVWQHAAIGMEVSNGMSIRLGSGAFADVNDGFQTISISQPGTYVIGELLRANARLKQRGFGFVITRKIAALINPKPRGRSTVNGARGEYVISGFDDLEFETEPELGDAQSALSAGEYERSVAIALNEIDTPVQQDRDPYLYVLALAYAGLNDVPRALEYAGKIDRTFGGILQEEAILLYGQLLIETLAFTEALELYRNYLAVAPDREFSQGLMLLSALCYEGLDDTDMARKMLERAIAVDPESGLAADARTIIESL